MKGAFPVLIVVFCIFILLSAFLLGVGDWVRRDSEKTMSLSGYVRTTCTLQLGQVDACPRGGWSAVWKRQEDGTSVVPCPFSLKTIQDLAQRDLNNYPLNVTLPCMCNPNSMDPYPALTCNFNDACFMEVPTVEYVQKMGGVYTITGNAACAIGSFILIFSIVSLVLVIILLRHKCCCACCTKTEVNMDYMRPVIEQEE